MANFPINSSPLKNALTGGFPLQTHLGCGEALENAGAILRALAEIFGVDWKNSGYPVLQDAGARAGLFQLITGVATTLEQLASVVTIAADEVEQVSVELTPQDFEILGRMAVEKGLPASELARAFLKGINTPLAEDPDPAANDADPEN